MVCECGWFAEGGRRVGQTGGREEGLVQSGDADGGGEGGTRKGGSFKAYVSRGKHAGSIARCLLPHSQDTQSPPPQAQGQASFLQR